MDTLRLLFKTARPLPPGIHEVDGARLGSIPALSLTWAEGHPAPGTLATSAEVHAFAEKTRALVADSLGVEQDRGVSRVDLTVTHPFGRPADARAVLAGLSVLQLPRCETIRRGDPVHSVAWAHERGARKLARGYDKGLERGGEAFRFVRLEDQRRFASGARPTIDAVGDAAFQREKFRRRFEPMRAAADGVRVASFPVVAQALADEVKYGYRTAREVERLAGALIILSGGAGEGYSRTTAKRRRRELREAGYVVAPDWAECVEVDLGGVLEEALDAWQ